MSVHKLTDGRKGWYFSCRINGKQYKKERWNNKKMATKTEAMAAENEFIRSMSNPDADGLTIYELYNEFVTSNKSTFKSSTQRTYATFERNELILIPNKRIQDIKHLDVLRWKNSIMELDISIEYKNRKIKIIKQLLEYGSIVYNMPYNLQQCLLEPLKDYSVKDIESKEKWLKIEDFENMMSLLNPNLKEELYYYVIFKVLYKCGLRIGELAALTKEDITNEYINVNKAFIKIGDNCITTTPKTKNSIRKVYISNEMYNLLETYMKAYDHTGTLFHKEQPYLNEQKVRRVFHNLAKQCSLEDKYEIKIHNLRHSCNCNLKAIYGFTEIEAAEQLGHTPKVSAEIYTHADSESIKNKIKKD